MKPWQAVFRNLYTGFLLRDFAGTIVPGVFLLFSIVPCFISRRDYRTFLQKTCQRSLQFSLLDLPGPLHSELKASQKARAFGIILLRAKHLRKILIGAFRSHKRGLWQFAPDGVFSIRLSVGTGIFGLGRLSPSISEHGRGVGV